MFSKIHSNYKYFKDSPFQENGFDRTPYIYIYISTPYSPFSSPSSPRFYTFPPFPFSYFPLSLSFVSPSLVPSPDESPRASIPARFILEQTLGLPTPQPRRQKATMQIYPLFATRSCRSAQPWNYDFWVLEHFTLEAGWLLRGLSRFTSLGKIARRLTRQRVKLFVPCLLFIDLCTSLVIFVENMIRIRTLRIFIILF